MEPILKNPFFPSILRIWKFFTTFHDYLDLPETFGQVSLYQFHENITHPKYITVFTAQLIEGLVRKANCSEKNRKNSRTAFYLAKQNKYNFFSELIQTSAFELGLTQVSFALVWRDLNNIEAEKTFEELSEKDKYAYLSMLTDLVSTNPLFKKNYMEALKTQYTAAIEARQQKLLSIQKKFISKLNYSVVLGKDSRQNCYFYVSKISDSIFKCELKSNTWKRIQGQENIKEEILESIIRNPDSIKNEDVDLLEQIGQIWNRIGWEIQSNSFDRHKKLFKLNEEAPKPNKMEILKEKLHQLDQRYSKFLSECLNFRWATKQRRIQFHKAINQAQTMKDLLTCFSEFYHETRHAAHKKLDTLDFYDCSLETKDQKPENFKAFFLHSNDLYSINVISEAPNSQKYTGCIYHHIKSFLEDSSNFQTLLYEYMSIFVQIMLGTIDQLYPGQHRKRLNQVKKLQQKAKLKQQQEEQQRNNKKSKLRKNNKSIQSSESSSDESGGNSNDQEQTAANKKGKPELEKGRRLRQKVKINYKIQDNSNSKKIKLRPNLSKQSSKSNSKGKASKIQPKRSVKGFKGKMILDSDSESEDGVNLSVSDNESETSKKSGLNLDNFRYEQQSQKVSLRRSQRNSSKKRDDQIKKLK